MPILRNDGLEKKTVRGRQGLSHTLYPGESVETYYFSADPEITVVDIEPLFSHRLGIAELDFTEAIPAAYESDVDGFSGAKVDVSLDADEVFLQIQSGEVTVWRQDPGQDPELVEWAENMPMLSLLAKGTMSKLYLAGTGSVKVIQWREL